MKNLMSVKIMCMFIISKYVRVVLLLAIVLYFDSASSQSIKLVPYPNGIQGNYGGATSGVTPIIYNNYLYFEYQPFQNDSLQNPQLAYYDGSEISLIPNPNNNGWPLVHFCIYNNSLYLYYTYNDSGSSQPFLGIASYNNNGFTFYNNPTSLPVSTLVYSGQINNTLYFIYIDLTGVGVAEFDGSKFTLIPSPNPSLSYLNPIIVNNNLYVTYFIENSTTVNWYLERLAGNSFSNIPIPNNGFAAFPTTVLYNNQICVDYINSTQHSQLGLLNGNNISVIPNPDAGNCGGLYQVYNNKLYFKYVNVNNIFYLGQYDGNLITLIPNPDSHGSISDSATPAQSIVYNNKLYYPYETYPGIYQLAQYDGSKITIIANPDNGPGFGGNQTGEIGGNLNLYPIIANNKLYLSYIDNQNLVRLAEFDGKVITLIPNPDTGDNMSFYNYGGYPIIYNNKLYLSYEYVNYINDSAYNSSFNRLAYLDEEALAVTLLNFNAKPSNNIVTCTWQTANETNTSFFIVQHSKDGVNFTNITKVYAAGNSSTTRSYSFTDHSPSNGINYYRLQIVDKDSKFTYSKTVPINIGLQSLFSVYPNPVKDNLFVQLRHELAEQVTLQIVDMLGKVVQEKDYQFQAGVTTVFMPTGSLAKGSYFIVVKGRSTQKKMFIKE